MQELGLAKYCVDISSCNVDVLADTFRSVVSDRAEIKSRMAEKLACYKEQLARQFNELFPPELARKGRNISSVVGSFVLGLASLANCDFAGDFIASECIARIAEFC